jgi:hypothetical protein
MSRQALDHKPVAAGACADCGALAPRRIECIDGITHSKLELCEVCWNVFRQRQMFAGGCCG